MKNDQYFILSLYNKPPYEPFVRALADQHNLQLLTTGGTADWCRQLGIEVETIENLFQLSPRLSGQVKTLHPDIFTALLAADDQLQGLPDIVGVAIDLTPFIDKKQQFQPKKIDIGGVALLRAAVKNHQRVIPVATPEQAQYLLENWPLVRSQRRRLAARALQTVHSYDGDLQQMLTAGKLPESSTETIFLTAEERLRYGENPHQEGAIFKTAASSAQLYKQLHGKPLSYTNCLDFQAGLRLLNRVDQHQVAIIKHTNPTGWARGEKQVEVFLRAWSGDPISAYGGVVCFNHCLNKETAEQLIDYFVEIVAAPAYKPEAVEILKEKTGLRILVCEPDKFTETGWQLRSFGDRFLGKKDLQETGDQSGWTVVSKKTPSAAQQRAFQQMWPLLRDLTSNAVLLGTENSLLAAAGGQQSRVDAVKLALDKWQRFHPDCREEVILASDGFFPFPDNIELAVDAGVKAFIAPGGSIRDGQVIEAVDSAGAVMVFTGQRLFSH